MPPFGSLTAAEQAAFSGPTFVQYYANCVPLGTVFASGTVITAFTDPINTIECAGTTPNWEQIPPNTTVWVGTALNDHSRGIYRVRLTPTDVANLSIEQVSAADPGLLPTQSRAGSIQFGDIVSVYTQPYAMWVVPPRIVYSGGTSATYYKDYAIGYTNQNSAPEPIIRMDLYKPNGSDPDLYLGSHAATFYDNGQTYATIKGTVTYDLWPTSASIASYSGTITPNTYTVTSGGFNTDHITVQFNAGGAYIWQESITDNNGVTATGYRYILVNDNATMSPIPIASIGTDQMDLSGRKMTITLNDNNVTQLVEGAMVIVWGVLYTNGIITGVPTASTQYVGWVQRITSSAESGLRQAEVEIVGPQALLSAMGMVSQVMDTTAVPSNWYQTLGSLSNASWLIWYLLRWNTANYLSFFNYYPFSTSSLGYRRTTRGVPASSVWGQAQTLAEDNVGCNLGCDTSGNLWMRQPLNLIPKANRASLSIRDIFNAALLKTFSLPRRMQFPSALLHLGAFWSDGLVDTATKADAPGLVRGQGSSEETQTYTVTQPAELEEIGGDLWADHNNKYEDGSCTIQQARLVYEVAQMQVVNFIIPYWLDPYNVGITTNAQLLSIGIQHNDDGTIDLGVGFRTETSGQAAVNIPIIVPTSASNPVNPPTSATPTSDIPGIGTPAHDGGTAISLDHDTLLVQITVNRGINWTNITGTGLSGTPVAGEFDKFSPWYAPYPTNVLGMWVLTTTGVFYTTNVLAAAPVFTEMITTSFGSGNQVLIKSPNWSQGTFFVYTQADVGFGVEGAIFGFANYGSTLLFAQSLSSSHVNHAVTGDIDQYGSHELLANGEGLATYGTLWRSTNYGGFSRLYINGNPQVNTFLQKPLLTFSGAANSSITTGSSECIIWSEADGGAGFNDLFISSDGGNTKTNILPPNSNIPVCGNCTAVPGDNSNVIMFGSGANFNLTYDLGVTWAVKTMPFSITNFFGRSSQVMFPRKVNNKYSYYFCEHGSMWMTADEGDTWEDWRGDSPATTLCFFAPLS